MNLFLLYLACNLIVMAFSTKAMKDAIDESVEETGEHRRNLLTGLIVICSLLFIAPLYLIFYIKHKL